MKQEFRKTSELSLWEDNPRNIRPKDFERLKKQIQELGQYKPLLITEDGTVIGGNMRLRAYMDLGIEDIWVSVVNPKDDNQMLAYALSDNDRAGYYDDDLLANLSSAYPDFEWGNYAVDLAPPTTLDDLFKADVVEDEVPELEEGEPVSKPGEIYQLGRHRLMCGDSTKIEDVEKLMNGQKADMVFTDPPYGVGYEYKDYKDNQNYEDYKEFCFKWLNIIESLSDFIVLTVGHKNKKLYYEWDNSVQEMVWYKKFGHSPGFVSYVLVCEPILVYGKCPVERYDTDFFEFSTDREEGLREQHTCPKPIKFITALVTPQTEKGSIVLDVFGGSGSTLIACEQLNRTCYMMELDPKYCDVIRKRYAKFIGKEETWEEVSPRVTQADQQSTQTS